MLSWIFEKRPGKGFIFVSGITVVLFMHIHAFNWYHFPALLLSCQVVSCLLLFLEEEDVLWMMCALIEDLLPPSYFSSTLLGVQTDQRVLRQLIVQYLPDLDHLLQEHDIGKAVKEQQYLRFVIEYKHTAWEFVYFILPELSLITLHWFLTSFASVVDIRLLLRIWDLLFYHGSLVLFQMTLGMLKIKVFALLAIKDGLQSSDLFEHAELFLVKLSEGGWVGFVRELGIHF